MRYQRAIAAAVDVPVAMSSLLLVPTLLRQLAPSSKLAIITADSRCLTWDLIGITNPSDQARIVIDGVEGTPFWDWCMERPLSASTPSAIASMESAFTECVSRVLVRNTGVGALLFECTASPLIAEPMRRLTNLPIYDILSICKPMLEAVRRTDHGGSTPSDVRGDKSAAEFHSRLTTESDVSIVNPAAVGQNVFMLVSSA